MSPDQICGKCRFWFRGEDSNGLCRCAPPRIVLTQTKDGKVVDVTSAWPPSQETQWCGEWKPRKEDMQ